MREEKAEPYREEIMETYRTCKGNLVRVHEELVESGCDISYPALTAFCRRNEIGKKPKPRAGRYHFSPGQEMQHDTSPHDVEIGGKTKRAQAASLVLCYSRRKFFQYYPTFDRFYCKIFLTDALEFFGGSCKVCMVDNTNVVRLSGTGKSMVPVPELEGFGKHFGFEFQAHEKGDANRSARVERFFHHIQNNYLAGRKWSDWCELNRQAAQWCVKDDAKRRRALHASPHELFVEERQQLNALPEWIPEVYQLHHRIVDLEGYVSVKSNRYSVPLIVPVGRQVEVRETKDRIDIYAGPRLLASHERVFEPLGKRVMDPAHRAHRKPRSPDVIPEERLIRQTAPELASYVAQLKKPGRGSAVRSLRRLHTMICDYPRAPLVAALAEAERFGLFDLQRVERMVLKRIAGDFFLFPEDEYGGFDDGQ